MATTMVYGRDNHTPGTMVPAHNMPCTSNTDVHKSRYHLANKSTHFAKCYYLNHVKQLIEIGDLTSKIV